jgi:hypothetical protein
MRRYRLTYRTTGGEKRVEWMDTYLSAFVKRDMFRDVYASLYDYESAEIVDDASWSRCKKEGCRNVPEYGMMFCSNHRRK